ncbi:TetR family transcriptional regulator [Jatrophihabitans sp. GAS493]|uniref:TetR/AcrR family transcriptional regulator n=1 Tax=Jatrophihabitans sp. GAS493 TaxID=1907575 RepID=UPI000BBF5DDC|nr:TetR/AcrR family transcriptional regulator [Jatrophihabitans sp. GAS493]SOD71001.1 TetR family transcriptional regulator [Jatrophihabitans sp. GAS493]
MNSPLNGRRAEAARNNERILDAARRVFLADPGAPISAVAAAAEVGISALYSRYDGKDGLLRALALDGLERYIADLQLALQDGRDDAWSVYAQFLQRVVEGGSQALAQRLAGTFAATPESSALARRAGRLSTELFGRTAAAGVLRPEITVEDVTILLEMLMEVRLPGADGGRQLRLRYLALVLDGLRVGAVESQAPSPLPGSAPKPGVLGERWRTPKPE